MAVEVAAVAVAESWTHSLPNADTSVGNELGNTRLDLKESKVHGCEVEVSSSNEARMFEAQWVWALCSMTKVSVPT